MKFIETKLIDCYIIEPTVHGDHRGYFMETYSEELFSKNGIKLHFIQDNESQSKYGVLRGLHYQLGKYSQAKLVRVIKGKVLDIALDIRKGSPSFGQHIAIELSEDNKRQLLIPRGFAHGFAVLSEITTFQYKMDNIYAPKYEGGIAYNDPKLNIDWQIPTDKIILSPKDKMNPPISEAELFNYTQNLSQK